jgi:hypothetical protein
MEPNSLNRWQKGDAFKAAHLNEPVDYLKDQGRISIAGNLTGPVGSVYTSNGTIIKLPRPKREVRWFWGKVITAPVGSDYTDARYYIEPQYLASTQDMTVNVSFVKDLSICGMVDTKGTKSSEATYITSTTATNIAEVKDGTHNIPYGSYVYVWEIRERASDKSDSIAVFRWVFDCPDVGRGQYQGMGLDTVAQNQRGWRYRTAHSMT